MIKQNSTLKNKISFIFLLAAMAVCFLPSCKRAGRSDISKVLFGETRNKAFKDLNPDSLAETMQTLLKSGKLKLSNPKLITSFYTSKNFEPVLVLNHLPKEGLKPVPEYLGKAAEHGLDPAIFQTAKVKELVERFYDKKAIKTTQEAYQDLATLELLLANAVIDYSNAMQFGILSPRRIYANYYTETKRPDSASMIKVFEVKEFKGYLDSIQPKMPQYLALQQALREGATGQGMSSEESSRVLKANLERLRWKNKPDQEKYVIVNIADFSLSVVEHNQAVLQMKVCVGEGRNDDFSQRVLKEYDETGLSKDRPFSRETPQLNSMIHSVQVNPVWNIPESIATKEITKYAAKDRFYLSSNNIDVYENGKLVRDPEVIDFSAADAGSRYTFKQRPGEENSLGKIKFLFKNDESVYLHDTPAKAAFNLPMRAVSHGCVRVEKPLELAKALFGSGKKYDLIQKEMQTAKPEAKDISLNPQVPVYLTYFTVWKDENGKIQFRKDIYGLDIVLDSYLQRLSALSS